ncbi:MAG: EEP domain-containing protein [Betaproteobacteria bacterium]|nr:MAG: EEP domain-containing protein [Betaproteobacteria bacterium]
MTAPNLYIASYNLHKGMSFFGGRMVLHEMRDRLHALHPDIVFLQEVQGHHTRRKKRFANWPETPSSEFLAGQLWSDFAYGKNAVYERGDHGNAILSRFPILEWENEDISDHAFEQRGLLHCVLDVPGLGQPLHAICLHLALTEGSRLRQLAQIIRRIRTQVPDGAPLIIAGDFNDWRGRACAHLEEALGLVEVFGVAHGRPARSFPAILPLFTLDRIYVRGFNVRTATVLHGEAWRRLSDHAVLTAHLAPR